MPSGVMLRGGLGRPSRLLRGAALWAMAINAPAPLAAMAAQGGSGDENTTTPIKHVIVIIGENRTFDHIFATYQPKNKSDKVWDLRSEGIVNKDGSPGRNYYRTALQSCTVYSDHVSVLKFIEANWRLSPLTRRSRDNLPEPKTTDANPYVPVNSPAIGDLMDLFRFPKTRS